MERYTNFAHDLALLGGQNAATARALSWPDFLSHWAAELPTSRKLVWDLPEDRMRWEERPQAPPEWSTTFWPDFLEVKKAEDAMPSSVLGMALKSCQHSLRIERNAKGGPQEVLEWLVKAGVEANVWPGAGSSPLAMACGQGNISALRTMAEAGQDLDCVVTQNARPDFLGSNLLFRIGPAVARNAKIVAKKNQASGASKGGNAYASVLRFLVKYTDDPNRPNANGVTPLGRIADQFPELGEKLGAIVASKKAVKLHAGWGGSATDRGFMAVVEAQNQWARDPWAEFSASPRLFEEVPGQPQGWPRAFRPANPAGPGQVIRALAPGPLPNSGQALTPHQVFELAASEGWDSVVERAEDGGDRVWLLSPRQARLGVGLPQPTVEPSRLRF